MRGEVPAAVENTVRWCDAVCRSDGLATRFIDGLGAVLGEEEIERVAAPNRVREADFGTALLVHGRLPPASVQLRPWHRDRRLKEMVNGAQATG